MMMVQKPEVFDEMHNGQVVKQHLQITYKSKQYFRVYTSVM